MKYSLLFRRLVIDEKSYYQLYDIKENFIKDDTFADYDHRESKDFFCVTLEDNDIDQYKSVKYMVYGEGKEGFGVIEDNDELANVVREFETSFKDFTSSISRVDMVNYLVSKVGKEVMYQDHAIRDLLEKIYMNQEILNSHIPEQEKSILKDNILLFGPTGNGKNSIVNSLKKYINIPYADVYLSPDNNINALNIAKQLSSKGELGEHGIVFIRDNFDLLMNSSEELANDPFSPIKRIIKSRAYTNDGKEFNFDKLTFVILKNVSDIEELEDLGSAIVQLVNPTCMILVEPLTPLEKKNVLLKSEISHLVMYRNIFKQKNRKIICCKGSLEMLINETDGFEYGMQAINHVIDRIVKSKWNTKGDIVITQQSVKKHLDIIMENDDDLKSSEEISEQNNENSEDKKNSEGTLDSLMEEVKKNICDQDEQVKRIIFTILRNRRIADEKNLNNPKRYIKNILLRGESGTGKTAILNEVTRLLNIPSFAADATRYTESGFKGDDVENMLVDLYHAADNNLEEAQKGILIIDEIDKKAGPTNDIDVSRGAVLNALLKIVEGTIIPINVGSAMAPRKIMFDTSRLTVICSGAYEGIEKIRDDRLGVKSLGFGSSGMITNLKEDPNIIDEDYVSFGMMRQFVARLGVIVNLNSLPPKSLKKIMLHAQTSELLIQKKLYAYEGITLEYNDDFCEVLSEKAYNKKIGARGIEKAFQEVINLVGLENIDTRLYEKVIFTKECLTDPNGLILVPRKSKGMEKIKKM